MTDSKTTCDFLNQVVAILGSSLPMYLSNAGPWVRRGLEKAEETLELVVVDQRRSIDRLSRLVMDLGGEPFSPSFPASYTGLNDVSLDYLLDLIAKQQAGNIDKVQVIVQALPEDSTARTLVEQTLGAARGHLETLQELATGSAT
ncbi:MAG: hypothetical protein KDA60_16435 [Planctomycetales bacterium]|nr:hypothetical protein [Planctomycetales bacterium]